mgnify:CR=1 FL=1
MSPAALRIGDRVEIRLESDFWADHGWFPGRIVRVEPYSGHRSFYWVELDRPVRSAQGQPVVSVSVFNPRNLRKP